MSTGHWDFRFTCFMARDFMPNHPDALAPLRQGGPYLRRLRPDTWTEGYLTVWERRTQRQPRAQCPREGILLMAASTPIVASPQLR